MIYIHYFLLIPTIYTIDIFMYNVPYSKYIYVIINIHLKQISNREVIYNATYNI